MSEDAKAKCIAELSQGQLVRWVIEGLRCTMIHYGYWFREVESRLGFERAAEAEATAGDRVLGIVMRRLGAAMGFEVDDRGYPAALTSMSKEELLNLIDAVCANWLANDGVWFREVEKPFGMVSAKHANDMCWGRFSLYEAFRIKRFLELPKLPGLDGLKTALAFRMYSRINKQSIEDVDEHSFIFRMEECRVQMSRKRKGLPDYPCKSAGMIEYPYFASAIDPGIETECIGCPPDRHPEGWFCAWKFMLKPRGR